MCGVELCLTRGSVTPAARKRAFDRTAVICLMDGLGQHPPRRMPLEMQYSKPTGVDPSRRAVVRS